MMIRKVLERKMLVLSALDRGYLSLERYLCLFREVFVV